MKTPHIAKDPRWARVVARDKTADGAFRYAVATTGVYCRPAGETASYSTIAERIGSPGSVRAVAGACAANALAVAIPCHRVVRHDGNLSGYRFGVERKRELIARESAERDRREQGEAA